jgi:diaminopimelate decarboxylase
MTNVWSSGVTFPHGELHLSGIPVTTLAREFGTPAFFVDESDFRDRAMAWGRALTDSFGDNAGTVYYAAKAFISVEVARWVAESGIGLDVCTGGELAVALAELHTRQKRMENGKAFYYV